MDDSTAKNLAVSFMQFCALVAKFTKTVSASLESIHQLITFLHKNTPPPPTITFNGDIDYTPQITTLFERKAHELKVEVQELRDSTANIVVVLKQVNVHIRYLPPSQQLVLNFSTNLIKQIVTFTHAAKRLDTPKAEIDRLYKEVLGCAKQAVAAINFTLKGI